MTNEAISLIITALVITFVLGLISGFYICDKAQPQPTEDDDDLDLSEFDNLVGDE
jgi:hypothetical protein